jgi:large subunit ribosomal protein L25
MERIDLEVSVREAAGKGGARKLRARGLVPAVVYGSGTESTAVQVDAHNMERLIAQHLRGVVNLQGPKGLKGKLAIIKDVQRDPLSRRLTHCDFYVVDTKKRINVAVPLSFTGKSPGVELGGVLEPLLREVEVSCLPLAIPDRIEVSVEHLEIGDSVHVRELQIPEGAELLVEGDIAVVHVGAPRIEEEVAPEVAPEEEEAAAAAAEGAPAEAEGARESSEAKSGD